MDVVGLLDHEDSARVRAKAMSEQPWYVEFFGGDYWRIYGSVLTPERTEREAALIVERLGLPPGSKILDLCCGHGRHSIALAAMGYEVTGLDLSQVFLGRARTDAENAGVQLQWVRSDMRYIPFAGEFDAVINLFTAFGYLESDADDEAVLHQVHKALKPGALFLLEFVNRESVMRQFLPCGVDCHEDGLIVLRERRFNLLTSRMEVQVTLLHPSGARTLYNTAVRFYTLTELAGMISSAGLRLEGYYGGLDGSEFTMDAHRLVLLVRKPED
jgi:ubiquinone/menaquinone biosynthesis C-methylase UbiE